MTERPTPTIYQGIFVSKTSLEAMQAWPLELRAVFDPEAERHLKQQAKQARIEAERRQAALIERLEAIPF